MAPGASYGLAAYYLNTKLALTGGVTTDGRLTATVKYAITDKLTVTADTKPLNYRAQFQLGINGLTAATYIQRVTPCLSLGGEVFCTNVPQKSGVGTRLIRWLHLGKCNVFMTYVHKISKKVSLATDFAYNIFSRDVKASVGYDCNSEQSRVQGKIDSNGVVSALLGKELYVGLECLLSANLDHKNKDYKLGLSLAYGSPVTTLFVK
ncbi:PREDICTED: mitochondrial import receptor subunit TOM40-1-like [Camelina sativa]|uniref:Mitochondrial import receptor subunit TOM40-1-like n=1 Tax=Camelina sativa TaxID=90675 RepID=A0ABM0Y2E4_CAMSA|nr:PREDICTED: mitochondrial import receptor subunit TOM40-1-like [Camelina sativa]XP_010494415.1 PREDICTED: mitochondrial import receptor subunit TOM40-1-like [Camelina sativa]XP_010494423.1 PREDICTED: mitochondrial import receptor subunit TOM40-1-like [Camelina sativa]